MEQIILFAYLVLFPFGQLAFKIPDLLVGAGLILAFNRRIFNSFIILAVFSFLLSMAVWPLPDLATGFGYLMRLIAYVNFYYLAKSFVKNSEQKRRLLLNCLLAVLLAVAVFGWYQYFFYPDLTTLKFLGWDDHYYRLVGTFLDPGYTALFLVFGSIISFLLSTKTGKKRHFFYTLFFLITLAFTYSRAGYLTFLLVFPLLGWYFKRFKLVLFFLVTFFTAVCFLPQPAGEGVNLARTFSVNARLVNYQETVKIFSKSPLFGVGFNNLCLAKKVYLNKDESLSHACSGSDSSLLLVLATTGVAGLLIFFSVVLNLF